METLEILSILKGCVADLIKVAELAEHTVQPITDATQDTGGKYIDLNELKKLSERA